jgi:hypothetical protein
MTMETKDLITLTASVGALIFSLLNYKRNSRFDKENYLYRQKVEAYSKILGELSKLINEISHEIAVAKRIPMGKVMECLVLAILNGSI